MTDVSSIPDVCTSAELAKLTGISEKSIRRMYREGYLKGRPPRGLTRPVMFLREDVIDWLIGQARRATA